MKTISLIILVLTSWNVLALTQEDYNTILMAKAVYAIAKTESEFNTEAVNESENAVGFLQIRPIMVREANRISGYERFNLNDRFSARISIEMFLVVQRYHNKDFDLKMACWIWNSGRKDTTNVNCNLYYKKVITNLIKIGGCMETLKIQGTTKSPEVMITSEGRIELSGKSIPEDAGSFYKPILERVKEYCENPNKLTVFEVKLEYFNTSSSKQILDIFKQLERIHTLKMSEVLIVWNYEEDDEDMLESGQDYESIVKVPFRLVQFVG